MSLAYDPWDPKFSNQVYDLLVQHGGAPEPDRRIFVAHQSDLMTSEWRFQGHFGFGGKLYRGRPRREIYIDCYHEDLTPERRKWMDRINLLLLKLVAEETQRISEESTKS